MNWVLAPAALKDAPRIAELWYDGWHEAHAPIVPATLIALRTRTSFQDRARDAIHLTRLATTEDRLLGFTIVRCDELYQIFVAPQARGTGVAQALITGAEERILAAGYGTAWLSCTAGNHRAAQFYERSGWMNRGLEEVELDTSEGPFPMKVLRFEKTLRPYATE